MQELKITDTTKTRFKLPTGGHLAICYYLLSISDGVSKTERATYKRLSKLEAHNMQEESIKIANLSNLPSALRHLSRVVGNPIRILGNATEAFLLARTMKRKGDLAWFADGYFKAWRRLHQNRYPFPNAFSAYSIGWQATLDYSRHGGIKRGLSRFKRLIDRH